MRRNLLALAATIALGMGAAPRADAEDFAGDAYGVAVQADVTYGQGIIGASGANPRARDLKLDVYRPLTDGRPLATRPAVIMMFGGAFHRGSKGNARFERAAGIRAESAWMPGFGHFYPMGAPSLGSDMTKQTLKTRVLRFLDQSLGVKR